MSFDQFSLVFYITHFPSTLIKMIYYFVKHKDYYKPLEDLRDINAIRKVGYYFKKHKKLGYDQVYIAYYASERYIEVRVYFRCTMKRTEYDNFVEQCSIGTGMKHTDINEGRGYYSFVLFGNYDAEHVMYIDEHKLVLGTAPRDLYYWEFDKYPHLLIVGETGSGKTNTLQLVLDSIVSKGYECSLIDDKGIDFLPMESKLKHYLNTVTCGYEDILEIIQEYEQIMDDRMKKLRTEGKGKYFEIGLSPIFLVIEEFSSLTSKVDKKSLKDFLAYMGRILQKGRTVGVEIIVCMQRPDASILPGEMRSNITTRVVCGANESMTYQMVYDDASLKPLDVGYAYIKQGIDLSVIAVPLYENVKEGDNR